MTLAPLPQLASLSYVELRTLHLTVVGTKPRANASEASMRDAIMTAHTDKAARIAKEEAEKAEAAVREQVRKTRAQRRPKVGDLSFSTVYEVTAAWGADHVLEAAVRVALFNLKAQEDQLAKESAKLAAAMVKDPAHALRWSMGVFQLGARVDVLRSLAEAYHAGIAAKDILRWATDCMLRATREGHSTSGTTNLMNDCLLTVWGDLVADLRRADDRASM